MDVNSEAEKSRIKHVLFAKKLMMKGHKNAMWRLILIDKYVIRGRNRLYILLSSLLKNLLATDESLKHRFADEYGNLHTFEKLFSGTLS